MATYLFVCCSEEKPEEVETVPDYWWSCSKTTQQGDHALVYITSVGVCYEWEVRSDAQPDEEWRYVCDVGPLRRFDPPITIQEICNAVARHEWAPPHVNFRGYKSIIVPSEIAMRIRGLRPQVAETES